MRLARVLRRQRQFNEALAVYTELAAMGATPGRFASRSAGPARAKWEVWALENFLPAPNAKK